MVLAVSSGERVGPFRDNTLPITFTCDDAEQFATTLLQLKSTALDGRPRRGNDNYARLVPLLFLQERGHHRGESVAATFAPQHRRASCRGNDLIQADILVLGQRPQDFGSLDSVGFYGHRRRKIADRGAVARVHGRQRRRRAVAVWMTEAPPKVTPNGRPHKHVAGIAIDDRRLNTKGALWGVLKARTI